METWKPVAGYEGAYEVSDAGRVRGLARVDRRGNLIPGRIRKTPADSSGYPVVSLCGGARKQVERVHRLVAVAFIPNPENKREVNHLNGDKADNRVSNLGWATPSENSQHAYDTGLTPNRGEQNKQAILNSMQVRIIRRCVEIGMVQHRVADAFGIRQQQVSKVSRREAWAHVEHGEAA